VGTAFDFNIFFYRQLFALTYLMQNVSV